LTPWYATLICANMKKDIWIGIEVVGHQATGWRFDGATPVEQVSGPTADVVLAGLGKGSTLIVQESADAQPVPAPVLPDTLPLGSLTQSRPRGHLDAAARLRIAGALADRRNWDGVICIPMANVTHWCQISANEVVSFQSAMTPFLSAAVGASESADPEALADTMSRPERLSVHLRSAALLGLPDALAGHLLGAELAAMRAYWLGQQVLVIAENSLYSAGLSAQGVPVNLLNPVEAARDGLVALREKIG